MKLKKLITFFLTACLLAACAPTLSLQERFYSYLQDNHTELSQKALVACHEQGLWLVEVSNLTLKTMVTGTNPTTVTGTVYPVIPVSRGLKVIYQGNSVVVLSFDNAPVLDQTTIQAAIAESLILSGGIKSFTVTFQLEEQDGKFLLSQMFCLPDPL